MRSFFVIHEPGKVPRIGFPLDDPERLDTAIEGWQHANPTAEIYVITYTGVAPTPGRCGSRPRASDCISTR